MGKHLDIVKKTVQGQQDSMITFNKYLLQYTIHNIALKKNTFYNTIKKKLTLGETKHLPACVFRPFLRATFSFLAKFKSNSFVSP